MNATAQRFCIVCGQPFEASRNEDVCPRHAAPSDISAGRTRPTSVLPGVRSELPGFGEHYVMARSVPPLVDFAIGPGGVVYALDSAMGGQACSVAAWTDGEFTSSAMLKVSEPLGIDLLGDGRPVVVGESGTVVVIAGLSTAGGDRLPATSGHQFHTHVSCVAKQPRSEVLAMGVPARAEVMKVDLPGFGQSAWVEGLPARPVAVTFSASGDRLAVGLDDGSLHVIDAASRARQWVAQPSEVDALGVVGCAAGAAGGWVVAYESQHLSAWDDTGRPTGLVDVGFAVSAVHADPGSGWVTVAGMQGEASIWSADLRELLAAGRPHEAAVVRVLLIPGAGLLVTGTEDGQVTAIEISTSS